MSRYQKTFLALGVGAIVIVLTGSIRVGAQNVSIDSNLSVSPNIISFETVFPGEVHFKPLTVDLSDSFIAEDILDDVEYQILQRTKPRVDTPAEREYCANFPNDLTRCYPSLCPYLSKTEDGTPDNDTSIEAFHDPMASSSIAFGRLAKSDNDLEDNWIIDLHTPCFKGQCDQDNPIPLEYQLDPSMHGEVFGCDLVVDILRISYNKNCPTCELDQNGDPVFVKVLNNITLDFNQNPPAYIGDPALLPYFTADMSSSSPKGWKAIFDLGGKSLYINPNVKIVTKPVGPPNASFAPGITIKTDCRFVADKNSEILVESHNRDGGDILINAGHDIWLNGILRNRQAGSEQRPGNITVASWCGDIIESQSGLIDDWGRHAGPRDINILSCDIGNIEVHGLVMGRASINAPNPQSQPDINVAAFNGSFTLNADQATPKYNNFSFSGSTKDLWGGLLSWVMGNKHAGSVRVQAHDDIIVRGHGRSDHDSFGAISAKAFAGSAYGGQIDVRSIAGTIMGKDRAFDVESRNHNESPVKAKINLEAAKSIFLWRLGPNATFGPTVDTSASGGQARAGSNMLRAFQQGITNNAGSIISALATGAGSTSGSNALETCAGIVNNGTITPADTTPANNTGSCAQSSPQPIWQGCQDFGLTP